MLWRSIGGPPALAFAIAAAAAVLIAAERRRIPPNLRHTALALGVVSAALLPFAREPVQALGRGLYVGGLLVALMAAVALLGRCAMRSPQVVEVGEFLRAQPGGRRYLGFTLASQLFSAMLSLAGANLLFLMASDKEGQREQAAPWVVAVTRGFSAATFWSPMFGNMAILLALYPTLQWTQVFPLGLAMAQATVAVGLITHLRAARRRGEVAGDAAPGAPVGRALAVLVGVMVAYLGAVLVASRVLGVIVTATIVLLSPLAAWVLNALMAGGPGRAAAGARLTLQDVRNLPSLAPEATLFMTAGCAGTILAAAFPERWAEVAGAAVSGFPLLAILALIAALLAMALLGVHPVLTSVFLASTFTPSLVNLPPVVHFCTILMAWGLSAGLTPFSVLALTAARFSGLSLYRVSLGENWRFTLACVALFSLGLTAFVLAAGP